MYTINKQSINNQEFIIIDVSQKNIDVSFMDYGATILNISVPDIYGVNEKILMEFESLSSYIDNSIYLNAIIGPNSGRIGNSSFLINDKVCKVEANIPGNANLHSASETFAFKFFEYEIIDNIDFTEIKFKYLKKQELSRFPGNQMIEIIYTVNSGNLLVEFKANTDQDTLINLTNHAYFNLSGDLKSTILNHNLYLNASSALKLDEFNVPYEVENILNTNLDYKKTRRIQDAKFEGIDNPFLLDQINYNIPSALLVDPVSKRKLEVYTDYECIVCYTHGYPNDSKLLNGIEQKKYMGICFETQLAPNSVNIKSLNDNILRKNEIYSHKTLFKFSIDSE